MKKTEVISIYKRRNLCENYIVRESRTSNDNITVQRDHNLETEYEKVFEYAIGVIKRLYVNSILSMLYNKGSKKSTPDKISTCKKLNQYKNRRQSTLPIKPEI